MGALITNAQKAQYMEEGYFILENALDDKQLAMLRSECDRFIEDCHTQMDRAGTDTLGITHRNKRYFIPHTFARSQKMHDFLFSNLMAEICQATIGNDARFFLDQFVVKAKQKGMSFSWHQDSGYIPFDHRPYVTIWTAMDDMTIENGTVYILPYSHIGVKTRCHHILQEETNDKVGYFGSDPGIPVSCPAGSIAIFSSVCFHRSGANTSDQMRRVMLAQFSPERIINPFTQEQHLAGIPFLKNGEKLVQSTDFPLNKDAI